MSRLASPQATTSIGGHVAAGRPKNTLVRADARVVRVVEDAFRAKLAALDVPGPEGSKHPSPTADQPVATLQGRRPGKTRLRAKCRRDQGAGSIRACSHLPAPR